MSSCRIRQGKTLRLLSVASGSVLVKIFSTVVKLCRNTRRYSVLAGGLRSMANLADLAKLFNDK